MFINESSISATIGEVNLPETRGMFNSLHNSLAAIGSSVGILLGGINAVATPAFYKFTLLFGTLMFVPTMLLWVPILFTIKKDASNLRSTLAQRAREMTS